MKRIAAILVLGGTLAVSLSSRAAASGDPLVIQQCFKASCGSIISVGQLTGPQLGDLVCSPGSETSIPLTLPTLDPSGTLPPPAFLVVICKQ